MLPEITGKAANDFFQSLASGEFTMMDVADHVQRENTRLKGMLAQIAHSAVNAEEKSFDTKSFVEGMLLTYGILHYQDSVNRKEDPDFVRPDKWWDGNEWFSNRED
tara:strand:+ start:12728 stop:13045 length:318 start_codon:yes stop_codon:yes gene_type:complete